MTTRPGEHEVASDRQVTTSPLDDAVRMISVFPSWKEMLADMRRGYIPTLRTDDNVAPTAELKAATRLVIDAALEEGCAVYAPVVGSNDEVLQHGKKVAADRASRSAAGWVSLARWPAEGDRIAWRKDHLGVRLKTGVVVWSRPGAVSALPDERNHGAEPDGGTSEIRDLADMRALVPGEGNGRLPDLRLDFHLVEHGYQVDISIDAGRDNKILSHLGSECRDFGDSHDVAELRDDLLNRIKTAIDEWRKGR